METKNRHSFYSKIRTEKMENSWRENIQLSKQEQKAIETIYSHAGKKVVFETYLKYNPIMARKYVKFIALNPWAQYMTWDESESRFKLSA